MWIDRIIGRASINLDEARERLIAGLDYAAYHETDFALYDSDKNRLFGAGHYNSGQPIYRPSPWSVGDFEAKMATLLHWADILNRSDRKFSEAKRLLQNEDSVLGRIIRRAKARGWKPLHYSQLIE